MSTVLDKKEYDISYFDGKKSKYMHNAGYSFYERQGANDYWEKQAKYITDKFQLSGKKLLELGCAKGFTVQELRKLGVDAYGIDFSEYALDNCPDDVKNFLILDDVRTCLSKYSDKEFDFVFSARLIECMPEEDLPLLIKETNRISINQIHITEEHTDSRTRIYNYYLNKTLDEWLKLDWSVGTILINLRNNKEFIK